ncbi:RNA 3'-terminal phosphate cyclase-domain-containing protein [Diplogelasinospora grovesii]|uniref:RNA 3'-terminal phosphate cyclase-domain-containing protein n=1 Tax=Diplogelasinospora grovesii TaxID=303347 RepID=A0AAN6N7C5_9PEZI|nr:RNA 3'-terminal phosphate cyclase-domain-containing protein [Diplogelasinospora grovesii]
MTKKEPSPIELDGKTGEGGGQLVRVACAIASVTGEAIRIVNVRGNRLGGRGRARAKGEASHKGGGLKSQHVASISWLAEVTGATTSGVEVGSQTVEFRPRLRPSQLEKRSIKIDALTTAASTTLILQAILPFLVFAGNKQGEPIEVEITGGTNVDFSPSFEYVDQVLLPTLEHVFDLKIERRLHSRGWSLGQAARGKVTLTVHPLKVGEPLRLRDPSAVFGEDDMELTAIDVSMIIPCDMQEPVRAALEQELDHHFPDVEVNFKIIEDSKSDARAYVLLVARSGTLRWGRDRLSSVFKQAKDKGLAAKSLVRDLCAELYDEMQTGGVVDVFLQDQLIIFQALAEGRTSFPRSDQPEDAGDSPAKELAKLTIGQELKEDNTYQPFGEGSLHSQTARWVTCELVPFVGWYNNGRVCDGRGIHMEKTSP